jgi:hypothetical protein
MQYAMFESKHSRFWCGLGLDARSGNVSKPKEKVRLVAFQAWVLVPLRGIDLIS